MKKYNIIIAVDTNKKQEFVAWLNQQGHDATVGTSTGTYIDGVCTNHDIGANEIYKLIWEKYCNQ